MNLLLQLRITSTTENTQVDCLMRKTVSLKTASKQIIYFTGVKLITVLKNYLYIPSWRYKVYKTFGFRGSDLI